MKQLHLFKIKFHILGNCSCPEKGIINVFSSLDVTAIAMAKEHIKNLASPNEKWSVFDFWVDEEFEQKPKEMVISIEYDN